MSTSTQPSAEFAEALTNVRRQTTSKLSHNSKPAQLLNAIEQTLTVSLKIDTLPHSSTAYFISLLQCLEKACSDEINGDEEAMAETENMGQGALIPATLYLLAIVIPETPGNVVISKLSTVLESILPLFENAMDHPPALRSLVQIITSLIGFASPQVLNSSPLLKKSWNYLLELNLDPRPKVRHLAQEGVRKVLTTPVPPKVVAGGHPYLPKAREWVVGIMEEEGKMGGASAAGKKKARFAEGEDGEGKRAIWVVQGLRGWAAVWGEAHMANLCSLLLSLPPIPHLTPQIYSLLANLFTPPPADSTTAAPAVLTNLPTVIDSLIASPPNINSNTVDIPSYLQALTSALVKMSLQDPVSLAAYIPRAFNLIYHDMLLAPSPSPAVMIAASDAIGSQGILRYCLSDEMIVASVNYKRQGSDQPGARKKQKTPFLSKLIAALTESLDKHALRIQYLLPILAAAISRLRVRVTDGTGDATIDPTGRGITAAEVLLMDLIRGIADLKNDTGFEHKAKVDEVVGMAIEVIGVEGILKGLPLNIEPDANGNTPRPGRAYLLPLIRSRTTNDSLLFFATYFRPLSERVFAKKVAAEEEKRGTEAKIWEAIVGQIWDCFPGFCEMPRDMAEALDTPFLSLLTNLLYNQQALLPSLLRALSQLVNSTSRLMNSTTESTELLKQFGMDQNDAKGNMDHLKSKAKDMVAVLLNVFAQLPREQRGMVGEVIGVWTSIMTEADIHETYKGVTSHLSTALESKAPVAAGTSPLSHTMLDLLIVFVPYLPSTQSTSLFNAIATPTMLEHSDATVQKKSYRLLKRLLENEKLNVQGKELEVFVEKLNAVGGSVGPGAQRDRLQLLSALVESLPADYLALIPEILSEAVLGTKEVNEKARDAGFDLLVVMGNKMAKGGSVTRIIPAEIEGEGEGEEMEEEKPGQEETVQANAEEYVTMVAAGLTAATPHMISASINALSRLLFEFKDSISTSTISELVATITVFLQSKNREIVKSALGFIKVAIVALPTDAVTPHLQALVPALLGWVHDHKNHFKQKTVHIFERMIRKFGYDDIYRFAGEGDEKKVLVGIRRKKERAKKKRAGGDGEEGGEEVKKTSSGNAFDDILYNSDSDLESDDDAPAAPVVNAGRGKGPQASQTTLYQQRPGGKKDISKRDKEPKKKEGHGQSQSYIRGDGDEPLDLLSRSIAGNVASVDPSQASRKRKPGQDASHFKTDKSGKLIIDEPTTSFSSSGPGPGPSETERMAGDAYLSGQMQVGGAVRDAKGNLKFNKNTKRAREVEKEYEDTYSGGVLEKEEVVKKKPKSVTKLGEEFRSKRGKGDVKKQGGPDPYSYVPIDQAARGKKGQQSQSRMSMTNKKKGSKA